MKIIYYLKLIAFFVAMVSPLTTFSQEKTVKGTVKDSSGEVLIGVSVVVPETTQGVLTDANGDFTLNVASNVTKLTFSYVSMQTITVPIPANRFLDVTMTEDRIEIDEVIVVGYGSMSKKNLSNAVVKVNPEKISKAAISNMGQMLMGRAAGLQATVASSQPGGNINISIRGGGTPIYVIDGVVTDYNAMESSSQGFSHNSVNRAGLAGLNPEDIESIEVLKDGAAAIYGLGASSGVILITTKKGKEGKMQISYNGSVSIVANQKYYEPLSGSEFMRYANLYSKELYLYNNKMGVYGPNKYDDKYKDMFMPEQISNSLNTDWLGEVLRNGSINNHNLSIQGGSEKLNYYLSGNFNKHKGNVVSSNMERYTLRSVVSTQLFKFMKLSNTINLNLNNYQNGSWGGAGDGGGGYSGLATAVAFPPYLPIYDENGEFTMHNKTMNPIALNKLSDFSESSGFSTNFTADFNIWEKYLTAKLVWGYTKEGSKRDVFVPSDISGNHKSAGSMVKDARTHRTMEAIVNFNKSFFSDDALRLDYMMGVGQYVNSWDGLSVAYRDINDVIGNDNIGAASGQHKGNSYRGASEKRSQFARLGFDLYDRYTITASLRRDGTDKFFPKKKYSLFPSASAAWKIFNENFMSDISWIDMLKARASYGVTGSDNLGTSLYGYYNVSGSPVYFDSKNMPYVLGRLDYPTVTWERNTMKDIGIDLSVLNNRINITFDYFRNDITDMLGYATSDGLSMFDTYPVNGGHIRKTGWDMTINTVNIQNNNFKWTTNLTFSANDAVWVERFPGYTHKSYQIKENESIHTRYYYRSTGIANGDLSNVPDSQPAEYRIPGYPIIEDLNNDGDITKDDIYSDVNKPRLYWGLANNFSYKGWDLDIFMYSQIGIRKYNFTNDWCSPTSIGQGLSNQVKQISGVWNSIDNPNGHLPGVAYAYNSKALPEGVGLNIGDEDASFVRVRNITLGYNFNKKTLGRLGQAISNLRVYCDVQNPFVFTSFSGLDPEVVTGGWYKGGKAEYPQTRTFSLGLNVSF